MNFKIPNLKSPIHLPQRKINLSCHAYLMRHLTSISNFSFPKKKMYLFFFIALTLFIIKEIGYAQLSNQSSNNESFQPNLPLLQPQSENNLYPQRQNISQLQ